MKKLFLCTLIVLMFLIAGCSDMPSKHQMEYEEGLETLNDEYGADAFSGSLDNSKSKYYITNDYYNMKSDDELHIISEFETYQQTTEYTCGCAALKMVLHHYGIDDLNELEIAKIAETDESKGTKPEGICKVLDKLGLDYESHISTKEEFTSYEDAENFFLDCIDKNMPVMVSWSDWGGHWQVVIGIDTAGTDSIFDDVIIFADPYDITDSYQDGYYTYSLVRFISMWQEGACTGKDDPYKQTYVTVVKGN